ncbi:MAG: UDP-3-O-(3-hydroxymyristoyl)glucosamine N-acyltransferase [Pseudomonadota bacterium]
MITLGELAQRLNLSPGDADTETVLVAIAPLHRAGPSDLAFISDGQYLDSLRDTSAGCVLLREEWQEYCSVPYLVSADPYLAYALATRVFEGMRGVEPGVHSTAIVHESVALGANIAIGPHVVVDARVILGEGVRIGAGSYIGEGTSIGAGTRIEPNVTIHRGVRMGRDGVVDASTVIGSDGFGFARHKRGWERIAQLGGVLIGDRVHIGSSCSIDRGALDDTTIGDDVIIDNQVHIAHNCRIGDRTAIAGCVGFAGSVEVGSDCTFAGQVGVSGHLKICDNAHFTGQARVTRSITEPGSYASGTPLEPQRQWGKNAVRFTQLDALQKRVQLLEKALAAADNEEQDDS